MSFWKKLFGRRHGPPIAEIVERIVYEGSVNFDERGKAMEKKQKAIEDLRSRPDKDEAIPLLMRRSYQTRELWASHAMDALEAINTPAAFLALLDVFRTVKRTSTIKDDGVFVQVPYNNTGGDDKFSASKLLKMPGAFEQLEGLCSASELEQIIILGGGSEMMEQLGTDKAVGFLLHYLLSCSLPREKYTNDPEPERQRYISALRNLGEKAVPRLLKAIAFAFPSATRGQGAAFKKTVLGILEQLGDQISIPIIEAAAQSDPSIREAAVRTISVVSERCGNQAPAEPSVDTSPALHVRRPPLTGDTFIDSCFQFGFEQLYEYRDSEQIEEVQNLFKIAKGLSQNNSFKRSDYCEAISGNSIRRGRRLAQVE